VLFLIPFLSCGTVLLSWISQWPFSLILMSPSFFSPYFRQPGSQAA
jgi:hypothetical protein